jgi:hypothetical protein
MPTQSDSIKVLLAGVECRHENLYGPGQVFRTAMRHGLAAVAVVVRSRRMIEPARTGSLMAPTRLALLAPPRHAPAIARAVLLATITAPADEEDLATLGAAADDKAKRIHGSDRDRQELDAGLEPWDEQLVGPGSGARPEGSRRLPRAFSLFGYGGGVLSQRTEAVHFLAILGRAGFARFYAVTDTAPPRGAAWLARRFERRAAHRLGSRNHSRALVPAPSLR